MKTRGGTSGGSRPRFSSCCRQASSCRRSSATEENSRIHVAHTGPHGSSSSSNENRLADDSDSDSARERARFSAAPEELAALRAGVASLRKASPGALEGLQPTFGPLTTPCAGPAAASCFGEPRSLGLLTFTLCDKFCFRDFRSLRGFCFVVSLGSSDGGETSSGCRPGPPGC